MTLAAALAVALALLPLAPPAVAQLGTGSHDSSQPIEVISDELEVQQANNLAIFSGNVDAIQGEMRLRADKLTVHYRNNDQAEAQAEAAGAEAGGAITKIVAEGQVFVSSPKETGQGDVGVYDVEGQTIVLEGKEVVLTQGDNVIRGARAVMDLETGRSVVQTKPGGRVRGLFIPNQNQGQTQ
ncbi:lipopolysaccharide transport periplasmic protein LptA [Marinibaculum pumilum]|uniref:Lipopolysaccharide transport periplasmic protein LptA n=1 Tax=Marinibaculum pumilum TaxID=1766165 RepID=A0ABV7L7W1_9PROT